VTDKAADEDLSLLRMGYNEALRFFAMLVEKGPKQQEDYEEWRNMYDRSFANIEQAVKKSRLTSANFAKVSYFGLMKK